MSIDLLRFRAILFDFDGVLGRTMEDNFRAWRETLREYGAGLETFEYYPLEGIAMRVLAGKYCAEKGIDPRQADSIVKRKEWHYLNDHRFALYPFVDEFIDTLRSHGVPLAIVSTALLERLQKSVPADFLAKFQSIVTGDKVSRGKPFPDPYLKAAEELGIPIGECIVIENSPLGIEAAQAAGAYCIAITSTLDATYLRAADEIVATFANLAGTQVIKQLLGRYPSRSGL